MWFYSRQCVRNNQNQIIQKRKSFDFLFIYPLFPPINFPFKNNRLSTANIKGILLCKYAYSLVYQAFSIKMSTSLPNRQLRNWLCWLPKRSRSSLPNRQLRKLQDKTSGHWRTSLPNRQLRNHYACLIAIKPSSLPNRQLRKLVWWFIVIILSSLPNRQLRKNKDAEKITQDSSLPNRQLRNPYQYTMTPCSVFTAE